MLSIHLDVKDFGDEDETNYETDEISKKKKKHESKHCASFGKKKNE